MGLYSREDGISCRLSDYSNLFVICIDMTGKYVIIMQEFVDRVSGKLKHVLYMHENGNEYGKSLIEVTA